MKKLIVLLGVFFVCAATFAEAVIKFDSTAHNFGTFTDEVPVSHTFTFTNTGDEPLVIHQIATSCGCTAADYTKEPVQPGGKGEVTITYDGKGRNVGKMSKVITVRSNATNRKVLLVIEGTMKHK